MSKQIALDNIHLRPAERWGHTEYSMEYHPEYISKVTGLAPDDPARLQRFRELWQYDFQFNTDDGLHRNWAEHGRSTDMGHAVYAADGADRREPAASPFQDVEEVWAFDAAAEYGLPDFDEQVAVYQQSLDDARAANPDMLLSGGYYKTIVSGAIQAFGWDMLLLGASNPARMEKVFDSFFRFTKYHVEAWAKTDAEVFIQHDDFVWSSGPFMHPDIYRSVLIARYAELWKPLHQAGMKVIFCSDGTYTDFAEDIVAAGADGLVFEPSNDFGLMAERFGDSTCLIGSCTDCRDMAFRPWETVRDSVDRTLALARKCKGLILAVGNHIPANVSDEMCDRYMEYLRSRWQRQDA